MTKIKISIFTLVFLSSFHSFAEQPVHVIETPKDDQVFHDSSAFNRMNKSFSLNYIATGFGPNVSGTRGINFGFYLDRTSLIDLEYVQGAQVYFSLFNSGEYNVKPNSVGIHYKHFVANSFYYRVGGDYRTVDYSYTARDIFNNSLIRKDIFTGSSIAATFLIGNQWQWDNFTLGCDWIGVAVPLTSQVDSESSTGPSPNYTSLRTDEDNYLKKSVGVFLRFYLGASF